MEQCFERKPDQPKASSKITPTSMRLGFALFTVKHWLSAGLMRGEHMEKATMKSTITNRNFKAPQTTTYTNQYHPDTFFFQCKKEGKNKHASEVYLMIYEENKTDEPHD